MKKFLQEYGFTIIAAIVIITLVAFSSPIGSEIKKQTSNITNSFGQVAETQINQIDDWVPDGDISNIDINGVKGDFSRKGNLVTIDGKEFRVLEVNGSKVKVMMMDDYVKTTYGGSLVLYSEWRSGRNYNGSDLENVILEYYNQLPEGIRKAIVEQRLEQSMYRNDLTKFASIDIGYKKVFVLDITDVIEYLNNDLSPQNLNKMFWNDIETSKWGTVWLRTSSSIDGNICLTVNRYSGQIGHSSTAYTYGVRPTFVIDLDLLY